MGLQKRIELDNGIILDTAYIKISSLYYYNKAGDNSYLSIDVNIFKDLQSRIDGKPEVTKFVHKCSEPNFSLYFSLSILNENNKNIISQAYNWMKSMSMYSGAIDIIDSKE